MNDKLIWRKASRSGGTGGNCVEIAPLPNRGIAVRDSKNPDGAVLQLSANQWEDLRKSLLASQAETPSPIPSLSVMGFLLCLAAHWESLAARRERAPGRRAGRALGITRGEA